MDKSRNNFRSQANSECSADQLRSTTSAFGPSYCSNLDGPRLSTQQDRLRDFMLQASAVNQWLTLGEIRSRLESRWVANFPEASISAQLRHLRKAAFGSYRLAKRRRGDTTAGIYEYSLTEPTHRTPSHGDVYKYRKTGLELFDAAGER